MHSGCFHARCLQGLLEYLKERRALLAQKRLPLPASLETRLQQLEEQALRATGSQQ